jgi:hypothetical protein
MSLECTLWQVTPEKLKLYRSSEESVEEFIDFCFPETFDEDVFTDESKTKKFYDKDFCLEKRWHLLHYLLTGDENSGKYPLRDRQGIHIQFPLPAKYANFHTRNER